MRCLIDTNIVIYREGANGVTPELQVLMRVGGSNSVTFLVHPLSKKEVKNVRDDQRRLIEVSKINTYPILESPPQIGDASFSAIIPEAKTQNEIVDNNLLYAVYKGAVDLLISQDRGIHTKAQGLNISDRVLTIDAAIEYFQKLYHVSNPIVPLALQLNPMHSIDLSDPFFDALKVRYHPFESWWKRVAASGRKAWVYKRQDGKIGALLVLKIEDDSLSSVPPLSKMKRVKICTLMVRDIGRRIGELLLKVSFDYARTNKIDELYLTHFPEADDYLVSLISQYGFRKVGTYEREDVYLKNMIVSSSATPEKISSIYYPSFYDGPRVQKHIVPIMPEYFERLFVSNVSKQLSFDDTSQLVTEQNTILKAYVCNTFRSVKQNDILLFYRSRDYKSIIPLGTVYQAYSNLTDPEKIQGLVGNRTVYSLKEITSLAATPATVILFRHHFDFEHPVSYNFLLKNRVITKPPRTITRISDAGYDIVKREGEIDECYTVH